MIAMKEIRERLGLTQAAVARELGVSRQTYNNWELGKRQADYEYLLRLGELFGTTVENILTGCLEPKVPKELLPYKMPAERKGVVIEAEFLAEGETELEKEKKPLPSLFKTRKDFADMFDALAQEDIDKFTAFVKIMKSDDENDKNELVLFMDFLEYRKKKTAPESGKID